MGRNTIGVTATFVGLTFIACEMQATGPTSSGPNCGDGTVEVNGTCQLAAQLDIQNGDTRASASTHWAATGAGVYNIAFYGDHTGVFWTAGAPNCPGSCHPPTPTACGDICVDMTTSFSNCGACGNTCSAGQQCANSTCFTPTPGGPSSSPGTGSEGGNGISGTFQWSLLANGGVLNERTDGRPFKNMTNLQGGVGEGNFSATIDGANTTHFTLASGPPCQ